jgi:hypothetical protein
MAGFKVTAEVQEKGFIEAQWHLELMLACPARRKTQYRYAPNAKTLSWGRRGLLISKCGTPISSSDQMRYSVVELKLLELLQRKALDLREPTKASGSSNFPESQREKLSLWELLSLIRFLGKNRLVASWSRGNSVASNPCVPRREYCRIGNELYQASA